MAFDGIVMANLASELRGTVLGGIVTKIAMPEKDELLITIRNNGENYRLLISAGASLPMIYLSDVNKQSPLTAPAFCMLLRKYIGTSTLVGITQAGLERILVFEFEHRDDLGDMTTKKLIVEIMGKYSNIIFTKPDDTIIDSIKRIPSSISSVREVLPGRKYTFPEELIKCDLLNEDENHFSETFALSQTTIKRTLYSSYAGISPVMARELCSRAHMDGDLPAADADVKPLFDVAESLVADMRNEKFTPNLVYRRDEPVEFAAVHLSMYDSADYGSKEFSSISSLLQNYYAAKDSQTRIRQKSADLRKIVSNALERASKKLDLQERQLRDCAGKDKYKVYGDLLNTYGYSLKGGEKSFTCENFYDDNREITIPLDEHKTGTENAKRYFDKYSKLRRTEEALNVEIKNTEKDVDHLSSIAQALEMSTTENDLNQIKAELTDFGYVKRQAKGSGKPAKADPLHFVSSDGYHIYVGKNNYQNEEVSFKIADGNDWWFHAKKVPGSHVIVKCGDNADDLPDSVFEEAASLAAYYSKNGSNDKVEVDYTQRKNLKRVTGGAPGFVIYHTNYSMVAVPKSEI